MYGLANAKYNPTPTPIIAMTSRNADDEEQLRAKQRCELGLTRGTLEEAATQDAHADANADRAGADQDRHGDEVQTNHQFHLPSPSSYGPLTQYRGREERKALSTITPRT